MKKKILMADDSATVLMMEKMILAREPYELIIARDGKEAVEKALAHHPDLILLDVVMPHLDGFAALRRLRQEEATRTTPVIMVTSRGEGENIRTGYADGCDAYLTKPIDSVELLAKVRQYLGA